MYTSLLDAPVNEELIVLKVTSAHLYNWLQRTGVFIGGRLFRHDEEIDYHPVRVKADKGEVVVPAGLGIKIFIHTDKGEKKPLVEMRKNETGHVESMSCGQGCLAGLKHLGFDYDTKVTFIRVLPHMDYLTVLNFSERTRLSEGEAARIWGYCDGEEPTQFYFARKGKPFVVEEIIGGKKITSHLETHGVQTGSRLILESITQTQEIHAPETNHITVSSPGGLRLYLTPSQAGNVVVKTAAQQDKRDASSSD